MLGCIFSYTQHHPLFNEHFFWLAKAYLSLAI